MSTLTDLLQDRPLRCVIVGLDNSGKSTLLHVLASGRTIQTVPSVGPYYEELSAGGLDIKAVDLPGGQGWESWLPFAKTSNAVVFVVDSSDRERLREARTALHGIMGCEEVLAISPPLLVVSNKIDRKVHMSEVEIIEGLGLDLLDDRIRRSMLEVSAIHHTNIREVIQWMVEAAAKSLG